MQIPSRWYCVRFEGGGSINTPANSKEEAIRKGPNYVKAKVISCEEITGKVKK